jgi:hypothetical protein
MRTRAGPTVVDIICCLRFDDALHTNVTCKDAGRFFFSPVRSLPITAILKVPILHPRLLLGLIWRPFCSNLRRRDSGKSCICGAYQGRVEERQCVDVAAHSQALRYHV